MQNNILFDRKPSLSMCVTIYLPNGDGFQSVIDKTAIVQWKEVVSSWVLIFDEEFICKE